MFQNEIDDTDSTIEKQIESKKGQTFIFTHITYTSYEMYL